MTIRPGLSKTSTGPFLLLNASAFRALGSPETVALVFDASELVLGVRPVDPSAASAFRGSRNPSGTLQISLRSFWKYYGLDDVVDATRRPAIEVGDVLAIDLKDPGIAVARRPAHA